MADAGDGNIAQYAATSGGLVLKTPETIGAGGNPAALVVSPDGRHVYATDSVGSVIWQYGGGNGRGTLTPLSPPSVTTSPASPYGIAIGPALIRFSCGGLINACIVHILPVNSGGTTNALIISATLVRTAPVGIFVERIAGKRHVRVGRVPFGLKRTGRLKIRWNLRVGGRRLAPGRYLVTLRMFDRHRHLIALAHPVTVMVR